MKIVAKIFGGKATFLFTSRLRIKRKFYSMLRTQHIATWSTGITPDAMGRIDFINKVEADKRGFLCSDG